MDAHLFNNISEPTMQERETSYTWFGTLTVIQKLRGQGHLNGGTVEKLVEKEKQQRML